MSKKIGTHRTVILGNTSGFEVIYHNTVVFRMANGVVSLDTGGYFTSTTKRRMNQALGQFAPPHLAVLQKRGEWYLRDGKGALIPFSGNTLTFRVGDESIELAAGVC